MALINLNINLAHLNTFSYLDSDPSNLTWRLILPWSFIWVTYSRWIRVREIVMLVNSWSHFAGVASGVFLDVFDHIVHL